MQHNNNDMAVYMQHNYNDMAVYNKKCLVPAAVTGKEGHALTCILSVHD